MGLLSLFKQKQEDPYFKKVPYEVINEEQLTKKVDISVVVPVYNAREFLEKTVDSVIVQTIGFEKITVILVDDGSNDGSRDMLRKYSRLYKNIVSVFLKKNTGTPAFPRNLGAHLANSTYITFLDADDWFAHDALRILFELMEETKVNYAVGKTIQVESKKRSIIGRYESSKNRKAISPFTIKHLFHHLGPRSRMMRLDVIQDNAIRYPEMKFAEDKQFFIDVLLHSPKISTTTEPIYYLNRLEDNFSLTKQTDIVEKMDSNIQVLKYVLDKNLPVEQEKMIVSRLVEFDSVTRLFDRKHFLKSEEKEAYYQKYQEVLDTFAKYKRPYDVSEVFKKPFNVQLHQLFVENRLEDLIALANWSKNQKDKPLTMIDGKPYHVVPLEEGNELKFPAGFIIGQTDLQSNKEEITVTMQVIGHEAPSFERIKLQHRDFIEDAFYVDAKVTETSPGTVSMTFDVKELADLPKAGYILYATYDDYEQTTLQLKLDKELSFTIADKKKAVLYTTVKGNLSVKVK